MYVVAKNFIDLMSILFNYRFTSRLFTGELLGSFIVHILAVNDFIKQAIHSPILCYLLMTEIVNKENNNK